VIVMPPNYAFKRTAGRGYRVSWCRIGPQPLNAALGSEVVMIGKKLKPRIPGLTATGFVEKVVPTGIGYTMPCVAVVAVPIEKKQFDAYVAGFRQIPGAIVSAVEFGHVSGWRISQGRGIGFVLQQGPYMALINVDPVGQGSLDPSSVESVLHTLTFA